MALRVFRVCLARYARLDGEGARQVGSRWNYAGRPVVYMAKSIALAVLEESGPHVAVAALLPDGISLLGEDALRRTPALGALSPAELGNRWLESQASAVLKVRSVVVPGASNYLLNPQHAEFSLIQVEPPAIFHFDERLFA